MYPEIEQPNIEKLRSDDPLFWAKLPRIYIEWLRHVGPQLEMDVSSLVLGEVLLRITGDDRNIFLWTMQDRFFDPQFASASQRELVARLTLEIETPELPKTIRTKLQEVVTAITPIDWSNQAGFQQAREIWSSATSLIEQQVKSNPKLRFAVDYNLQQSPLLSEPWQEFFYGNPGFSDNS